MPGLLLTPETDFQTLQIKKLHPTFAAEIEGVDFSKPIPDDVFREILAASAKVMLCHMVACRCWLAANRLTVRRDLLSQDRT